MASRRGSGSQNLLFPPGSYKQCPGSITKNLEVMKSILIRSLNIGHLQNMMLLKQT